MGTINLTLLTIFHGATQSATALKSPIPAEFPIFIMLVSAIVLLGFARYRIRTARFVIVWPPAFRRTK